MGQNVEVRESAIEGLGVFALESMAAGECIREINVLREITSQAPLREDEGERMDHCDYPDGKMVLLGYPDRHLNHSCDPNAYVRYEEVRCFLIARRDIARGQEITCDYNLNITGGSSWPCHCGASRCRGETLGDFFKLPREIQREYRPLLADWFVRSHSEALRALEKSLLLALYLLIGAHRGSLGLEEHGDGSSRNIGAVEISSENRANMARSNCENHRFFFRSSGNRRQPENPPKKNPPFPEETDV